MPLLLFVMSLALRGIAGMAGLAISAYAGFTLYQSSRIISNVSQAGETPPAAFLVQHYGYYLLILAAGLALVYFAVRDMIRRIGRGLPRDEETVGRTPAARLGNIAIYGAMLCFGVYSMAVSLIPGVPMALLVLRGVTTDARITGFTATADPKHWIVKYRFTTADGRVIDDTTFEDGYETPTTQIMSHFKVTYIASNPAQHDVTEDYSHSGFVLFVVLRLAITLVGAFGLYKNIAPFLPQRPGSGEPAAPSRPAPSTPRSIVATSGTRPRFGRRGL